jgi:metal-responsive CopG/Arc/MetJ family transcriptional regulator
MDKIKRFTISMDSTLHSWIRGRSKTNGRSMSSEVVQIVKKEKVAKEAKSKKKR